MKKEIIINNQKIQYEYIVKRVKNINLRIKPDGSITVSAGLRVKEKDVEDFILSKRDFILRALDKFRNKEEIQKVKYFDEDEIKSVVLSLCEKVYPEFEKRGVKFPEIRFRKMISQWGNCYPKKNRLTFSTNLMYAPSECVEYVVCHEFTHFLVPNHSKKFYEELSAVCSDWKVRRNKMRNITS